MAKRELIDIEDAITECRNSFDISEAVVNMRDWCHIITEQEIVKPYLEKLRAEIEKNAYPIVHGVNSHEQGMTVYGIMQAIDNLLSEQED